MRSILIFLFLLFDVVHGGYYNFQTELYSNCDGTLSLSTGWKAYTFSFSSYRKFFLNEYFLPIQKIQVQIHCQLGTTASVNAKMKSKTSIEVTTNPSWVCNGVTAQILKQNDQVFYLANQFPSFWIGAEGSSFTTCNINIEDYEPFYVTPSLYPTYSPVNQPSPDPTVTPTSLFTWAPSPAPTPSVIPLFSPAPTLLPTSLQPLTRTPTVSSTLTPTESATVTLTVPPTLTPTLPPTSTATLPPTSTATLPPTSSATLPPTILASTLSPSVETTEVPSTFPESSTASPSTLSTPLSDNEPWTMDLQLVTGNTILSVDLDLFSDALEKYSNGSLTALQTELNSWKQLNLRYGKVTDWENCGNNVNLAITGKGYVNPDMILKTMENPNFENDVQVPICDILNIDIQYEQSCGPLGEMCELDFHCCNDAICHESTCHLKIIDYCRLTCPSMISLESEDYKAFFQAELDTTLFITTENEYVNIYVFLHETKLIAVQTSFLELPVKKNVIYYILLKKESECSEKPEIYFSC